MLYLVGEDHLSGALALEDEVGSEAAEAIDELHQLGVTPVVMITGDSKAVADAVGEVSAGPKALRRG